MTESKPKNPRKYKFEKCTRIALSVMFLGFLSSANLCYSADNTSTLKSVAITDAKGINKPPTAVIKYTNSGAVYTFNASQSSDSDGSIASYKWDFGDGTTATGPTATHSLSSSSDSVTLTVTDNGGAVMIAREAIALSYEMIIDDNDTANFSKVGTWIQSTSSAGYYNVGYKTAAKGDGSSKATWKFTLPVTGSYNLYFYYTAATNRASNAPVVIKNNGSQIATYSLNQQINGKVFFKIGSFSMSPGSLEVVLTNGGNGYSIADAVKLNLIE